MALHITRPLLHQKSSLSLHTCSKAAKHLFPTKWLSQSLSQVHITASRHGGIKFTCSARRRVRYAEEEEEDDEEYGNNLEIAVLESYSEKKTREALLVKATVDGDEELVLIYKGFSSCLSAITATDPSRSVLPARAVIQSIDVIRGPFDPNNIEYLEKGSESGARKKTSTAVLVRSDVPNSSGSNPEESETNPSRSILTSTLVLVFFTSTGSGSLEKGLTWDAFKTRLQ